MDLTGAKHDLYKTPAHDVVTAIAINHDGSRLATGGDDRRIIVWDISGAHPQPLTTLLGHRDKITSLAFSPSGELLASGSEDRSVIMWSLPRDSSPGGQVGDPVVVPTVSGVTFYRARDADHETTLAVGALGLLRWPLNEADWRRTACHILGVRVLTDTERRQYLNGTRSSFTCD